MMNIPHILYCTYCTYDWSTWIVIHRLSNRQDCFFSLSHSPSMTHPINPVKMAPIIQKEAITDSNFPLTCAGNNSAPNVNTDGTDPPIPTPATTRHTISQAISGVKADARPAIRFRVKEYIKQGLRPMASDKTPQSKPPKSIPMNTADESSSGRMHVTFTAHDSDKCGKYR